jgi:hypothetical protein
LTRTLVRCNINNVVGRSIKSGWFSTSPATDRMIGTVPRAAKGSDVARH